MNSSLRARKNVFKKGSGFSRYNKEGNVIYSESIGNEGETVRHFYDYDSQQHRIYYRKEEINSTFEEITEYSNNGYKTVYTSIMPEHIFYTRIYNSMGRMIEEVSEDKYGNIIHKVFDAYRNQYTISKSKSPFEYIL